MYLWIGLGIESMEEEKIRAYCKNANIDGVCEVAFSLPQHISLKTSFDTDQCNEIISFIKDKYIHLSKLTLKVAHLQKISGIIWLKIKETAALRNMHNELNTELNEKFGVGMNGYDGSHFSFHSTLFLDTNNIEKINDLFERICDNSFYSPEISVDKIYFGVSQNGKAGTYKVIDFVELA